MYSVKAIEIHFWTATIGIVIYIAAMWIAGVMQGLMWRAVNADGTLTYTFVESVKATYPFYVSCAWAVACCTSPACSSCCGTCWKTATAGRSVTVTIPTVSLLTPEENNTMANHNLPAVSPTKRSRPTTS
jgi:cytochrome c oxidase cbb3-type subunit 1